MRKFAALGGCLLLLTPAMADERINAEGAKEASAVNDCGAVTGVITFRGEVPRSRVADNAGQYRALLKVDRRSQGLGDVVAYLVIAAPRDTEVHRADGAATGDPDERDARAKKTIVMDQREHTFVPHVLAIRSGQTVQFTNSDTANHNVRASSLNAENEFNIFTGAGGDYRQRFLADRNRPVRLGCDIHPWMRAWIYAFDHPYYAVTDARGRFRINQVPPGKYQLVIRQPDGGLSHHASVEVETGQVRSVAVEFTPDDLKGV